MCQVTRPGRDSVPLATGHGHGFNTLSKGSCWLRMVLLRPPIDLRIPPRSAMRRPPQLEQKPRPLHEKATSRSRPQAAHRNRANPPASDPQRRKSRNSASTKRGKPRRPAGWRPVCERSRSAPVRSGGARPRRGAGVRNARTAGPRAGIAAFSKRRGRGRRGFR